MLHLIKDSTLFYQAFSVSHASDGSLFVIIFLFMPLIVFFIQPIFSLFSRKHEFEADAYAADQTSAKDLISSLIKLYKENSATLTPHPWYSQFFDSHPPASERIGALKKYLHSS